MKNYLHQRVLQSILLTSSAIVSTMAVPGVALAQEAAATTDEATAESIIVLGTRRTDRTVTDSASPVDVVSAAELTAQPAGNMLAAKFSHELF